jgi:hypothetical protein
MLNYVLRWLAQKPNRTRSFLRCDPVTVGLSILAVLLLMVRCDG